MYNNGLLVGGGYAFTSTNSVGAEVQRNFGVLTLSFPILHRSPWRILWIKTARARHLPVSADLTNPYSRYQTVTGKLLGNARQAAHTDCPFVSSRSHTEQHPQCNTLSNSRPR